MFSGLMSLCMMPSACREWSTLSRGATTCGGQGRAQTDRQTDRQTETRVSGAVVLGRRQRGWTECAGRHPGR
jgi:hypothetical protein